MNRQIRKTMLWLATGAGALGVALVIAFLQTRKPNGQLLLSATVAATFSAGALFLSVMALCIESLRRMPLRAPFIHLPKPAPMPVEAAPAQGQLKRQEILRQRLDIDEARFCTSAKVSCTCWSLCGPAPDKNPPEATGHAACANNPGGLQPIHRGQVPGCHLRQPD